MSKRLSLHTIVPAMFTLIIILAVSSILVIYGISSQRSFINHATELMERSGQSIYENTRRHLLSASDAVALLSMLADSEVVDREDGTALEESFYSLMSLNSQISAIFIGRENGDFLMASRYNENDPRGFFTKDIRVDAVGNRTAEYRNFDGSRNLVSTALNPEDDYDPRTRPWYAEALRSDSIRWTRPYLFFTSQQPGITASRVLKDDQGNVEAVIAVDLTLGELSEFVAENRFSANGSLFILDESRNFLALPEEELPEELREVSRNDLLSISDLPGSAFAAAVSQYDARDKAGAGDAFTFRYNDQLFHAVFIPLASENWSWTIGSFLPEQDILGPLIDDRRNIVIFTLIAGSIFALVGFLFSTTLTRPLKEIQQSLRLIEGGGYPSVFPRNMLSREFVEIMDQLKAMSDSLQAYHQELEERVARRTEDLRLANEAKSRFLAMVSHEMRSPLQAILGYADILREKRVPRTEQQNHLQVIVNEGRQLQRFIAELLDSERISEGRFRLVPRRFELTDTLGRLEARHRPRAMEKGLAFSVDVEGDISAPRFADDQRLEQILNNLLANAVKYTPSGEVRLEVTADQRGVGFAVQDSGPGIPSGDSERIFKRFEQLSSARASAEDGYGLGLAIARDLVELFGGTLELESPPEGGARFSFRIELPSQVAATKRGSGVSADGNVDSAEGSRKATLRVLLADDYPVNQRLLRLYLKDLARELVPALSGEDALRRAEEDDFDLILMDITLPGIDGVECAHRIRLDTRNQMTPIIAITAGAREELDERLAEVQESDMPAIFTGILEKPFSREQLREAIVQAQKSPAESRPIAMQQVIEQLDGDHAQAVYILEQFLEQSDGILSELQQLLESENWKESHRLVHSLKNGAEALFAGSLAERAKEFESTLKGFMKQDQAQGDDDRILVLELLRSLLESFEEVQNYCEQHVLKDTMG
jgi:signal transduction histidine kinase/CheY-like chemotaxis protein/HPt (histidine-containing phosphotransfer) domain-containing protein